MSLFWARFGPNCLLEIELIEIKTIGDSCWMADRSRSTLENKNTIETVLNSILKHPIIREDTIYISVINDEKFTTSIFE